MRSHISQALIPSFFAATALAVAVGAAAQMAPPPSHTPPPPHPMTMTAPTATPDAAMKSECQAMMAKKQEMHAKMQAMDATLDKLVAEMNAAQGSKETDALERPMLAVLNELVAQHKAMHAMRMGMDPAMANHMMRHMGMHGPKGAMADGMCPMMKPDATPTPH